MTIEIDWDMLKRTELSGGDVNDTVDSDGMVTAEAGKNNVMYVLLYLRLTFSPLSSFLSFYMLSLSCGSDFPAHFPPLNLLHFTRTGLCGMMRVSGNKKV